MKFYRYRRQVLCTDSALALTRGRSLGPWAFVTRLHPTVDVYSAVSLSGNGKPALIGQMKHASGHRSARLVYLMPESALDQPHLTDLLETMAARAGAYGAFHLLAEVDESLAVVDGIRRAGFTVYAWQRIWQFRSIPESTNGVPGGWRPATSLDEIAIRNLYHALVPPLVQSAEPLLTRRPNGWVYRQEQEDEILAYVEGVYGPRGIFLQPLIHPAVENVSQVVSALLAQQPSGLNRPVYIAIRSYQAWLETVVRDLECQVGPRQALMVKHLVAQQRLSILAARHSVLEKYTTEPTVPMVQHASAPPPGSCT